MSGTVSDDGMVAEPLVSTRETALPRLEVALGLAAGVASLVVYARSGFGPLMFGLWLFALLGLGAAFARPTLAALRTAARPAWADLLLPLGVAGLLAPLYLVRLYDWPVQVDSDEVVVMVQAERWAAMEDVDLFGLTDVFGIPAALFVLLGEVAGLIGGADLQHMRLIHASLGVATIAVSYALFRQLLPRSWAAVASALLGLNHAFLMISRMALRENTAVLLEVAALALLVHGLRRDEPLSAYLGGALAGLGFYVYFPGRVTIFVWLFFLAALGLLLRAAPLRRLAQIGGVAVAGCVLVGGPVVIAGAQVPPEANYQQRAALLLFPEAREVQRQWVAADSVLEGYLQNVEWGLTTFNNRIVDHGWIYENYGHGFLDPLTGVLLWVGALAVLVRVRRRDGSPLTVLPLIGFLTLWLAFAFLVNKAPNYTRLLVVVPFVAYLAAEGIRAAAGLAGRRLGARAAPVVAGGAVAAIAVWNVAIAWDYVDRGRRLGDDIGSTGRVIEALRDVPGQRFYIAASQEQQYFNWGYPEMYRERVRHFAREDHRVGGLVAAEQAGRFDVQPPFALFMPRSVWEQWDDVLRTRYPDARLRDVTPDARLVVLEASA